MLEIGIWGSNWRRPNNIYEYRDSYMEDKLAKSSQVPSNRQYYTAVIGSSQLG